MASDLTFKGSRPLTPDSTEFRFEPQRPVRFAAGQFMELNLPHAGSDGKGRRRVFSITSAPGAEDITFGVGTAEPLSTAKKALLGFDPGTAFRQQPWVGTLSFRTTPGSQVLLIAAGIGITPFLSQLAAKDAATRRRGALPGEEPG